MKVFYKFKEVDGVIKLLTFPLVSTHEKGWFIMVDKTQQYISKSSDKKFASPNIEGAYYTFVSQQQKSMENAQNAIIRARKKIKNCREIYEREKEKIHARHTEEENQKAEGA